MSNIQEAPDDKQLRYCQLVVWRRAGKPVAELAAKYGLGSSNALYHQLRQDGFPVCEVCGDYSKSLGHCEQADGGRARRARSGIGQVQELPPAGEAIPLFKEALKTLAEKVDALRNRKEYFQDGRFVAEDEYHDPIIWPRGPMSDEQWQKLCESFGQDPDADTLELWDARFVEPVGAVQAPQEPLTSLIAVYILADLPLRPLLERLHFAPEAVDEAELVQHIEGEKVRKPGRDGKIRTQHILGLKTKSAQIARLVRGGTLRPGPSTGTLSPGEQYIIWYIQQQEAKGVPEESIFRELREKRGLTRDDYARLRKFRLNAPSE